MSIKNRSCGILLHITSLPSSYGVGTLGKAAYEFLDWMHKASLKIWQVLPLVPTGYGYSQDLIASIFKVKSGRAYYMIKNANMLNMKLVKQKLEELTKLEYDIKSGRQEQTLGLELFILK